MLLTIKCKTRRVVAIYGLYVRLLFIDLSRDGNFEISKAEFGHIFLQFHGHVYLVQGKEK